MKILQVNTADRGGGAEGSVWNLFEGYAARGHDSWLAVGSRHSNHERVFEIPRFSPPGPGRLPWWVAWLIRSHFSGFAPARGLARRLEIWADPERRRVQRLGLEDFCFPGTRKLLDLPPAVPDIVHCHNLHGGYFDVRELPALSRRRPLILNLRDTWLLTGHCAYFVDCNRWRTGCGHCPDLGRYPGIRRDASAENWRRKAEIYAASRLYVTAPSQWLLDCAQASMLGARAYRLIPNGIDGAVFRPGDRAAARRDLGLPPTASIVLFAAAARRNVYKDPDTMNAIIRRLASEPGADRRLFVCLGRSRPRGLSGVRVLHVPFQRDPRIVARYYQAADVFVHTARAEAFGKTATEAMACGTPVVASAVGGLPEQILDGRTGFLGPPGDAAAMAALVERILGDAKLRDSLGREAAVRGAQFSLDRQISAFLDWYAEILATEE